MLACLDAARVAPSCLNLQPCRYAVYSNRLHIFVKKRHAMYTYLNNQSRLDAGVAMCHLMLAAEEEWRQPSFFKSEVLEEKGLKNNTYVYSFKME